MLLFISPTEQLEELLQEETLLTLLLPGFFRRTELRLFSRRTVLHFHVNRCLLTSNLQVNLHVASRKAPFPELSSVELQFCDLFAHPCTSCSSTHTLALSLWVGGWWGVTSLTLPHPPHRPDQGPSALHSAGQQMLFR